MTPDQFTKYIAHLNINIKKAINRDLPRIAGNEAARLFRQNFQKEGFFGAKWQEVNRRKKPGKGADRSRKILTGRTGDLGRSIKVKTEPGKAVIYSDLKYSLAHNEGTSNAGRGNKTKIPQRRFIGNSPVIEQAVKAKIEETMKKLFNS